MARRIIHYAQLRLLSHDELAQYVAHRCAVAGAARARSMAAPSTRSSRWAAGNLCATDDLAFKSLDYAAAGGHAAVSVQQCNTTDALGPLDQLLRGGDERIGFPEAFPC